MTDYAPRGSPDQNSFYTNQHLGMSHHCNGNGYNYLYNNGQVQYEPVNASYSSYSPTYLPSQHGTSSSMYMPTPTSMAHQHYQLLPPTRPTMPQQPRYSFPGYSSSNVPTQRPPQQPRLQLGHELSLNPMADIESQESCNSENMLSEPILPALDGYPDVHEFDDLMKRYGNITSSRNFANGIDVAMSQICRRRNKTKH